MIPFYIYYSMFGFQRIGDLMWLAGDIRAQRFPAGRHRRAHHAERRGAPASGRAQPDARQHDSDAARVRPAFAYEVAVIIADGMRRMLSKARTFSIT